MANYRQIHVSIWKDEWFLDLDPREKLLFIYLFSNSNTNLAGIYKLPFKVMVFETCLDAEYVTATLAKFRRDGKVFYEDGIVWVRNMRRYHESKSPLVQQRITADIASIPECKLKIDYLYTIHTRSYKEEEEDKDKEEEEDKTVDKATTTAIYRLYESEVGSITKVISERIGEAIDTYPGEWFKPAFEEAARNNKRNWAYIEAILRNWKANGFQSKNGKQQYQGKAQARTTNTPDVFKESEYAGWYVSDVEDEQEARAT